MRDQNLLRPVGAAIETALRRIPIALALAGACVTFAGCAHEAAVPARNQACTLDARLCPDGSAVGRTGPNCSFARCPGEDQPHDWTAYRDEEGGIEFEYPLKLGTWYITAQSWPPVVELGAGMFFCDETPQANRPGVSTEERSLKGRQFCVTTETEGAAGSVYTRYTYTTRAEEPGELLTIRFTMRFPQCANYDEPDKSECEQEHRSFSVEPLVLRLARSVGQLSGL